MVPVAHEVQRADPVDVDRRHRLAPAHRLRDPLPALLARRREVGRKCGRTRGVRSTVPTIESRSIVSRPSRRSPRRPSAATTSSNGRIWLTSSGSRRSVADGRDSCAGAALGRSRSARPGRESRCPPWVNGTPAKDSASVDVTGSNRRPDPFLATTPHVSGRSVPTPVRQLPLPRGSGSYLDASDIPIWDRLVDDLLSRDIPFSRSVRVPSLTAASQIDSSAPLSFPDQSIATSCRQDPPGSACLWRTAGRSGPATEHPKKVPSGGALRSLHSRTDSMPMCWRHSASISSTLALGNGDP